MSHILVTVTMRFDANFVTILLMTTLIVRYVYHKWLTTY